LSRQAKSIGLIVGTSLGFNQERQYLRLLIT
jgi:hypothetical protein